MSHPGLGAEHVLVVRASSTDPNFCLEHHQRNRDPQKVPGQPSESTWHWAVCPHLGLDKPQVTLSKGCYLICKIGVRYLPSPGELQMCSARSAQGLAT